jgi:PAS domain S-box-containing protein
MNKKKVENSFFDLNPQPSWIYDYETRDILNGNAAAIKHYGYERKEILKLTLKDLKSPEEISRLRSAYLYINNEEENIYFGIFTHKKNNGDFIRVEINGRKVFINNRHCMLLVCQDITEKENLQKMLQENARSLEAISSIGKIGYWRLQLDGKALYWTEEVYRIWGVNKENFELSIENIQKSMHPNDLETFITEKDSAIAEK